MRGWAVALLMLSGAGSAAVTTRVATADYKFAYSYPDAAAHIPELRAFFEKDRAREQTDTASEATAEREERKGSEFSFNSYDTDIGWQIVTETPRFLSLSGENYHYTGGAHGMTVAMPLLWDKARHRLINPGSVFDGKAFQAAAAPAYCARLDAERARRRKGYYAGPFDKNDPNHICPKLSGLALLLGSSNRKAINRLGLIADPYTAGPYAEGVYEVTLPVTPAIRRAVKPEYRSAFAVGK